MSQRRPKKKRRADAIAMGPEDPDQTLVEESAETEGIANENAEVEEIVEKEVDWEGATTQHSLTVQTLASGEELLEDEFFWILGNLPTGAAQVLRPSHETNPPLSERKRFLFHFHTRNTNDAPAQWITYSIDMREKSLTQLAISHIPREPLDPSLRAHLYKTAPRLREGNRSLPLKRVLYQMDSSEPVATNDSALFAIWTCLRTGFGMSRECKIDISLFRWFLRFYFDEDCGPKFITDHLDSAINTYKRDFENYRNPVIAQLEAAGVKHEKYGKLLTQINHLCLLTERMRNAATKDITEFCDTNNLNTKHANVKNLRRCCAEADTAQKQRIEELLSEATEECARLLEEKSELRRRKVRLTSMFLILKGYHWDLESQLEALRSDMERLEEEGDAFVAGIREEWETARSRLGLFLLE